MNITDRKNITTEGGNIHLITDYMCKEYHIILGKEFLQQISLVKKEQRF